MNSTSKGNQFRDSVAELLEIANYQNIQKEIVISSKKVDVYFEEVTLGKCRRTAVECKNYDKPLTRPELSQIYSDYHPLIESNHIDEVLIVAPHCLDAQPQKYMDDLRNFSFITYEQLENNLMDFTLYLKGLVLQYKEEGLNEYYVHPFFNVDEDLESYILKWLKGNSGKPIAILAGYGMGKTSFARHIAHKIASEKPNLHRRIPILIRLGEISSEQDLEGLISKVLAANSIVKNYHFNLFMELNRRGKFFIILDGFDEMKHTMTWGQFKYNFEQLNRLIMPKSKVLLLGRPSSLLSDAEYYLVLKGLHKFKGKEIREPGWPQYEEIRIEPFNEGRAHGFIRSYITYLEKQNAAIESREIDNEFISKRVEEIQSPQYRELISRPVQAKMLTDIAVDPNVRLKAYSRYELYELFISRILEREQKKISRKEFTSMQRHEFIKEVAWWLWSESGLSGFTSEIIPSELFLKYLTDDGLEIDSVKRDLLSGSILETKSGDSFYFPHRSFQEFLVSEYITETQWDETTLHQVSKNLNPEVIKFIQESGRVEPLLNWFELLSAIKGELTFGMLSLVAWGLGKTEIKIGDRASERDNPWYVVIKFLYFFEHNKFKSKDAVNFLIHSFQSVNSVSSKLMALECIYIMFAASDSDEKLKDNIVYYLSALILKEALPSIEEVIRINSNKSKPGGNIVVPSGLDNIFMDMIIEGFVTSKDNDGKVILILSDIYKVIDYYLQPQWVIESIRESFSFETRSINIEYLANYSETFKVTKKGPVVAKFFREFKDPKKLTKVQTKKTRKIAKTN